MHDIYYGQCPSCKRKLWTYSEAKIAFQEGCPNCGQYLNGYFGIDFVNRQKVDYLMKRKE